MRITLSTLTVLACLCAIGQDQKPDSQAATKKDPFAEAFDALKPFLGTWEGSSSGPAGTGKATCAVRADLAGRIMTISSQSVFPKTETSDGEKRGDMGVLSLNKADGKVSFRQFHSEGYFIRYEMEVKDGGRQLVFTSNLIENFSPGWSARLTMTLKGDNTFDDMLELKQPEKEWFRIAGSSYRRVRDK